MTKAVIFACAMTVVTAAWGFSPLKTQDSVSIGNGNPGETMYLFEQVDLNKDGTIGREEAKVVPGLDKNFEQIDSNGDGRVSEAEFAAIESEGVIVD